MEKWFNMTAVIILVKHSLVSNIEVYSSCFGKLIGFLRFTHIDDLYFQMRIVNMGRP